MYVNKFYI